MKSIMLKLLIISLLPLCGCGVYSFTGASISPDIKTVSIQTFYNNAPLGPSNMSVVFTERIKDYYQQNTSLEIVEENGDLQLDGYIHNYDISPVGANSSGNNSVGDVSDLSRLIITVKATYINTQDETFDFENRSFSSPPIDFDANIDLSSNEQDFIEEAFDQIVIDIFNASVANW
ncbi:MAG: LptE family protein [Cyclobacteriaceae bacterium]|nr:LptE family protein [Cyclobacteriaceae bacterium HetDA_MAG_MS6]